MDYSSGMKNTPAMGDKPYGNSRSLVPEISGRGVNGNAVKPCNHGGAPKIVHSTNLRNNGSTDLRNTGRD